MLTFLKQNNLRRFFGAAFIASTILSNSAFAVEGAGAKLSFFGDDAQSSPYTITEQREDEIYSPYSPYGDGSASIYNKKLKGDSKETAFWKEKFANSE